MKQRSHLLSKACTWYEFAYQETFRAPGPYISWPLYFTGSVQIEDFFCALSAHCVYPDSSEIKTQCPGSGAQPCHWWVRMKWQNSLGCNASVKVISGPGRTGEVEKKRVRLILPLIEGHTMVALSGHSKRFSKNISCKVLN